MTFTSMFFFVAISSVMPPAAPVAEEMAIEQMREQTEAEIAAPTLPKAARPDHVVALAAPTDLDLSSSKSNEVCREGLIVMIPDGREAVVTSWDGQTCRVIPYGEAYVSLWLPDLIEPVYPQNLPRRQFGH